jgi:hypothetical protein
VKAPWKLPNYLSIAEQEKVLAALGHSVITITTMYAHISTRCRREKLAEYLK